MYKYSKQVAIRWIASILVFTALFVAWYSVSLNRPEILTPAGIKALLVEMSVSAEYAPIWVWPIVFLAITLVLFLGIPSIFCFAALYAYTGFTAAFLVTYLCQIFVTRLAMRYSMLYVFSPEYQNALNPSLKARLWQNHANYLSFAFWARLYSTYPLRTIDELTPVINPDENANIKSLAAGAPAVFIRTLLSSLWGTSLLNMLGNISYDPQGNITFFLVMSSIYIIYVLLPKIPELFICPASVRDVLYLMDGTETDDEKLESEKTEKAVKEEGRTETGSAAPVTETATQS